MLKIETKKTWLVTGCAGFIGSNLIEYLLKNEQLVIGLDNFATGYQHNLDEVQNNISNELWQNFTFIRGDIRDLATCINVTKNIDIVLHQAALGSVPRSINDPLTSHEVNVSGFMNMLKASVDNKVRRFVYASSSSVYGDHPDLPKHEQQIGSQLSPYAVTKYANELYANVFAKIYNIEVIGLRYFNVFGRRQDPNGAYAAVIPLWVSSFLNHQAPIIYGDGDTSRDFCYIDNVVEMNVLCGLTENKAAVNLVYNVACATQTSLNQLYKYIKDLIDKKSTMTPVYKDFRQGDVRHSLADISLAKTMLGYTPRYSVMDGLRESIRWYQGLSV